MRSILAIVFSLVLLTVFSCSSDEDSNKNKQDASQSQDGGLNGDVIQEDLCKNKVLLDQCKEGFFCAKYNEKTGCFKECTKRSECGDGYSCYYYYAEERDLDKFLCMPCGNQNEGESCKYQTDCKCGLVCAPGNGYNECFRECHDDSECKTADGEGCIAALGYRFKICAKVK